MNDYIALLRRRPHYRRLWTGSWISELGDWLSVVAVSLLAIERGGGEGALALAGVLAAHSLPHALLSPVGGWLADRVDRRRLLLGTHLAQSLATLVMAAAASAGSLAGVTLALWLRTGIGALDTPARSGLLKRLVAPDELLTANALSSITWSAIFSLGMGLGGLLSGLGAPTVLLIDAASFAIAAGVLWPLPSVRAERRGAQAQADGLLASAARQVRDDLREAVEIAIARPALRAALVAKLPLAIAGGGAWLAMNLIAAEHAFLGTAGLTLGAIQIAKGLGTAAGPHQALRWIRGGASQDRIWRGAIGLGLLGMGAFLLAAGPAGWLLAALVWGAGTGANWVISTGELQVRAPDAAIGRLSSLDFLLMTVGQSAAALLAAALIESGWSLAAAGGLVWAMGLAVWAVAPWLGARLSPRLAPA